MDWTLFHIIVSVPSLLMMLCAVIDEIIDCFEIIEEDENDAEN